MPDHPPIPDLRASDAERESAVGRLRVAAMEGRLTAEELAERVSAAYDARWRSQLDMLTVDVTPPPVPQAQPSAPVFVAPRAPRTNGLAIASVILGLVWMWWMGSIVAIVLGHLALGQIARSGGRQTGRGLAVTGLVLGYLGLAALALRLGAFALL